MATTAAKTLNSDIFSMVRRINRFIFEILKSQSSGVSQTMPFDVAREGEHDGEDGQVAVGLHEPVL